jgi:radical SAM protein with 4Fe4S-binding SPASM domain
MTQTNIYYRPIWTCGRYNEKAQAAIYYNLVAGMSYFFESYSAMVIGEILSVPRNGTMNLETIGKKLNIAMESLAPFFQQLEQMGIVSSVFPTGEIIADYRKRVSEYNCQQEQKVERTTQEKLPYAISNAEQMYTEKVGGITSVMFELTYRCSEKCIHCYNEGATRNDDEVSTRGDREELTFDDYTRIIDELYEQGLVKVCLTGGDPFSKCFVWELIDYLYNKGIAFDVFTNGQRIVNDVERLANYYPRLVGVSIYSGIPEVHDYITRIKGSWDKSMSVVRQLSALGVPVNLKCCVMRPNVKSYYMVADIAKQYGAGPQFEISLTDSIEGDKCVSKYLRMTKEQLEIVLRDDNVPLYIGKEAPNYGGQSKPMNQNPCGAGDNSFCITPEGNVIPCCAFHTLFGNLKENTISNILNNSKELLYWRGLTLNDYEECGRYDYCAYCNLCPGNNFVEHGTPLKASEINCFMAKTRYDLAQKMMQGYDPLKGKTLRERLAELPDYVPMKIQREMSLNDYSDTKLQVGG